MLDCSCVAGQVASRTTDLHDGFSCVDSTASRRESWVSLVTWSALRSGGLPRGRRHDDGGVEADMSMVWASLGVGM